MVTRKKTHISVGALAVALASFAGVAVCAGCAFAANGLQIYGAEAAAASLRGIFGMLSLAFAVSLAAVGMALASGDARRARPALGALRALGHSAGSLSVLMTAPYLLYSLAGAVLGLIVARFASAELIALTFGASPAVSLAGALTAPAACALLWLSACCVYYIILRASPVGLMDESLCETSGIGGSGAHGLTPFTAVRCAFFRYKKALVCVYCAFAAVALISVGALSCISAEKARRAQDALDNFDGVVQTAASSENLPIYMSDARVSRNGSSADAYLIVSDDLSDYVRLVSADSGETYGVPAHGALVTRRMAEVLNLLPGDVISVSLGSGEIADATVRGVFEGYAGNRAILGVRYAAEIFGSAFETNAFLARGSAPDMESAFIAPELNTARRLMPFAGGALILFGIMAAAALYSVLKTRLNERADSVKMLLACGYSRAGAGRLFALDCSVVSIMGLLPAALLLRTIYSLAARFPETTGVQLMRSVSAGGWLSCAAVSVAVFALLILLACAGIRRMSPGISVE